MDGFKKVMFMFVALVLVIASFYTFGNWFSKTTGYAVGEDEKVILAQCLSGKNIVFYGSIYCRDCEKQREDFGRAFEYIAYIECKEDNCLDLEDIPAWKVNNTIYYGYKSFDDLKNISGCVD